MSRVNLAKELADRRIEYFAKQSEIARRADQVRKAAEKRNLSQNQVWLRVMMVYIKAGLIMTKIEEERFNAILRETKDETDSSSIINAAP